MKKNLLKLLFVAMIALFAGSSAGCGTTMIEPGHVGILVNSYGTNRGVQDYTTTSGRVWYNPISTAVIMYPTYVQTVKWTANPKEGGLNDKGPGEENESITFTTAKSVAINADISLSFQLNQDRVPAFYVKFRSDDISNFAYGFLHNVTRDAMMEVGGHYTVEDVMGNNEKFLHEVRQRIQDQVGPIGVEIQQFGFIGAPRPPDQIRDAINEAQRAQYLAAQKQNELQQAQAEAAKSVAYATGEANSTLARAEGQAKANKLLNESLTDKVLERARLDVQWHWIDRWNGQTPSVTTSGGSTLMTLPLAKPN